MSAHVFTHTVSIQLERRLPVTPGRLFHALTDSAEVSAWMRFPATVGSALGGRIMVQFSANDALDGVICAYRPDQVFAYTWADSIVSFTIQSSAGTANPGSSEPDLVLTQTGVSPDLAAGLAAGWHGFLDQLQQHLTGVARTSRDADLITHYKQVYAGFARG